MEAAGGKNDLTDADITALVNSFSEITSSTKEEAAFYLESHQWDLDTAVSTFLDHDHATSAAAHAAPDESLPQSPSRSRSRSLSPAPAVASRLPQQPRPKEDEKKNKKKSGVGGGGASGSRSRGGIRTLADLNRNTAGSDSDGDDDDEEMQEYYTGGEKSGMLVQDPSKKPSKNNYDADAIFDHAKNSLAVQKPEDIARASASASKSFTGTGRLLSGETVPSTPQPPAFVTHTITLWRNGFSVDDGPLRRLNDPANAEFLESVKNSECPRELFPPDRRTEVHLDLVKRDENYTEPVKKKAAVAFQGVGRTLGASSSTSSASSQPQAPPMTAPTPSAGLTVDSSSPTTSIQLRLADGTRMVSRFNLHHTVRDVRAFIMASRPGEAADFHLQTMGFPPRKLADLDQTIQDAGIANSVVIQKF